MDVNVSAPVCIIVPSTDFSAYHLPKCGNNATFLFPSAFFFLPRLKTQQRERIVNEWSDRVIKLLVSL